MNNEVIQNKKPCLDLQDGKETKEDIEEDADTNKDTTRSEVKEAVMSEPEKVSESGEEVRAQRSAGLSQLYHSPDILHVKRQTTFNKGPSLLFVFFF